MKGNKKRGRINPSFTSILSNNKFKMKRGVVTDYLVWIIIGLAVLALLFIVIFILKGKGISIIDKIKEIFRA